TADGHAAARHGTRGPAAHWQHAAARARARRSRARKSSARRVLARLRVRCPAATEEQQKAGAQAEPPHQTLSPPSGCVPCSPNEATLAPNALAIEMNRSPKYGLSG